MNVKRLLGALVLATGLLCAEKAMALIPEHGSILGKNLTAYDVGQTNSTPFGSEILSVDYKLVTIGDKPYVWVRNNGSWNFSNANYGVQLRFWATAGDYTQSPIVKGTAAQEYCFSGAANRIPATGSFKEAVGPPWSQGGTGWSTNQYITLYFFTNRETNYITYDKTMKNSAVAGDNTAPTLTSVAAPDADITETTAKLTFAATDANDFFYYIKGEGIEQVCFLNEMTLTGLSTSTSYSLQVTAVDFSGNESAPQTVNFTTKGMVNITSGIAQDIRFIMKSTTTDLEYYCEFTDPTKTFRDASLKLTPAGGAEFELKPEGTTGYVSPDGKYCYIKTNNANIAGKVLNVKLGYFVYEEPINYENWVVNLETITSGENTGLPIMHLMGGAVASPEVVAPVLTSANLVDVTDQYILLDLQGSDNSGVVYYEITGAEGTVNAFRTGEYYLKNILPGKAYTLTITGKDLSGNSSTNSVQITVKTPDARGNVFAGQEIGTAWNNNTPYQTNPELVVSIERSGNQLTFKSTTASDLITNAAWKDRAIFSPTVRINGSNTGIPMTLSPDGMSGSVTFTDEIEGIKIEDGVTLTLRWTVGWTETAPGSYLTGEYIYKVGDDGQADTEAPTIPAVTANGFNITWKAASDLLSGVKEYKVYADDVLVESVYDLGEGSFTITLPESTVNVKIEVYDFAGNMSEFSDALANIPPGATGIGQAKQGVMDIIQSGKNITVISENAIKEINIYAINGQLLAAVKDVNSINVAGLTNGVYVLKVKDAENNTGSFKVAVK